MALHSLLLDFLNTHGAAKKTSQFSKNSIPYQKFKIIEAQIASFRSIKSSSGLIIKASLGQGAWANVPWIAILDRNVTTSTQDGVFIILLFREDMSGFYLTLNQGFAKAKARMGKIPAAQFLIDNAVVIREQLAHRIKNEFVLNGEIDLRVTSGIGLNYAKSTIVHKFFDAKKLVGEFSLEADLEELVSAYKYVCTTKIRRVVPASSSTNVKYNGGIL